MASAAGGRMYVVETDRKKEKGIDRIMISENLKKYATEKFEGRRELLAPVFSYSFLPLSVRNPMCQSYEPKATPFAKINRKYHK